MLSSEANPGIDLFQYPLCDDCMLGIANRDHDDEFQYRRDHSIVMVSTQTSVKFITWIMF